VLRAGIYEKLKDNMKEVHKTCKDLARFIYVIYLPIKAIRQEHKYVRDVPKGYEMQYSGTNLIKNEIFDEPKLTFMTRCTWFELNNDVSVGMATNIQKSILKWYKKNLFFDTIDYIEKSIERGYFTIDYYAKRKMPRNIQEFLDGVVIEENRYYVDYKTLREYVEYLSTETNWGSALELFIPKE